MNINLITLHKKIQANNIRLYDFKDNKAPQGTTIESCGQYGIFLNRRKIENEDEEFCVTVHEYGHCATGTTHKVCSKFDLIEKHEYKANKKSITDFLPLRKLQKAFDADCREIWQIAEFLDLPYKFVEMGVNYYKQTGKLIS